jgi:hypothetical protein
MRWSADYLKRGMGMYVAMREAITTQALNELRDRLLDVQNQLAQGQQKGEGQKGMEQALAQAERIRRQMEQLARAGRKPGPESREPGTKGTQPGRQGQPGQQSGQGQQGQTGQAGQSGQSGQPGQVGESGQSGGQRDAGGGYTRYGGGGPAFGPWTGVGTNRDRVLPDGPLPRPATPEEVARAYRDSLHDLSQLEQALRNEPEIARDVQELISQLQRMDPRRLGTDPLLAERINTQVLTEMEQVELKLRRKVDDQGGTVRSGAGRPVPPGYADAVAEYFRRLSKDK